MTEHDDDDDPQLSSLRAVWLNMPDEDPPERGLAELMAAARVKAEEMATPSWWQRLVALLRRPPVLALATVLVLLGGAVFVGQRRDKLEATPEVASGEPAQTAVASPASPASGSAAQPMLAEPAAAPAPEPAQVAKPAPARIAAPERQRLRPTVRSRAEATAPGRGPATGSTRGATRAPARSAPPSASGAGTGATARTLQDKQALDGTSFELGSTSSAPAPRAQAPEAPKATAAPEADAEDSPVNRRASTPSRAAQYLAQAKSAAARGDCAAARELMKRAASADAAAYRKALADDAALKKCSRE